MADIFTKKKRSEVMAAIRSVGNKSTELKLLAAFRANRLAGWRRHVKMLGSPDFYFREGRLAIFVDGCFWHGCKRCGHIPKSRSNFWQNKIERNVSRDLRYSRALKKSGVTVIRVWEHDLKTVRGVEKIMSRILKRLAHARNGELT